MAITNICFMGYSSSGIGSSSPKYFLRSAFSFSLRFNHRSRLSLFVDSLDIGGLLPKRIGGLLCGNENTNLGEKHEEQQLQPNPTIRI